MGIGKNKLGMFGMMAAMVAMGSMDPLNNYTGQGKVGSGRDPEPKKKEPRPLLGSLLIDDANVPKGLTKETINFKFTLQGYVMAIKGDVCYTNAKRREQRITALERQISDYVLGLGLQEILKRGEFEILEEPKKEEEDQTPTPEQDPGATPE